MGRTFRYELPFPPSVNTYWRTAVRHGRQITYISAKGREFRALVLKLVTRVAYTNRQLQVLVELLRPDERKRDIDNYQKAVFDALKYARVYHDDCQIADMRVKWIGIDPMLIGKCTVTVKEIE